MKTLIKHKLNKLVKINKLTTINMEMTSNVKFY